jgi:hypothetical protein
VSAKKKNRRGNIRSQKNKSWRAVHRARVLGVLSISPRVPAGKELQGSRDGHLGARGCQWYAAVRV